MNNNATDVLLKALDRVKSEKDAAIARFNSAIQELETAIERLSGKKVWEMAPETRFDDEHPDYIRQSAEEI